MLKIRALEKLIHEFAQLPGIGPKSAQRMAYHVLRSDSSYAERLSASLAELHSQVHQCPTCFIYTDEIEECRYCLSSSRSDDVLCVVEEPSDIVSIEASGVFQGRYHILHGTIAPLDGVEPGDLKIKELLERIKKSEGKISEIILALDADLEGDTTVLYLTDLLKQHNVSVSRIAHGVPIGGNIDYIDERTMGRALDNRVEL